MHRLGFGSIRKRNADFIRDERRYARFSSLTGFPGPPPTLSHWCGAGGGLGGPLVYGRSLPWCERPSWPNRGARPNLAASRWHALAWLAIGVMLRRDLSASG